MSNSVTKNKKFNSPMHVECCAYSSSRNLINLIISGEECKLQKSSLQWSLHGRAFVWEHIAPEAQMSVQSYKLPRYPWRWTHKQSPKSWIKRHYHTSNRPKILHWIQSPWKFPISQNVPVLNYIIFYHLFPSHIQIFSEICEISRSDGSEYYDVLLDYDTV